MESEADEEPGQSHDQGDEIRTSNEQNDKEEIDIEKYHGIISCLLIQPHNFKKPILL